MRLAALLRLVTSCYSRILAVLAGEQKRHVQQGQGEQCVRFQQIHVPLSLSSNLQSASNDALQCEHADAARESRVSGKTLHKACQGLRNLISLPKPNQTNGETND
jgi:hypothetical protein